MNKIKSLFNNIKNKDYTRDHNGKIILNQHNFAKMNIFEYIWYDIPIICSNIKYHAINDTYDIRTISSIIIIVLFLPIVLIIKAIMVIRSSKLAVKEDWLDRLKYATESNNELRNKIYKYK